MFHCDHWAVETGNTSMPSKTTVIQLNRRVYSNVVACAAQNSTDALNQCCSTTANKPTTPPKGTTWAWVTAKRAKTENTVPQEEANGQHDLQCQNSN